MSVLIKGMEMPKSCSDCPCFDDDNDDCECAVCGISKKPIPWKWANSHGIDVIYLRPTDCPLVEVPAPHGRLIDADALLESIKEAKKKQPEISDVYDEDYFAVAEWVAYAPTVIKSEDD